jgi:hypothetical protein
MKTICQLSTTAEQHYLLIRKWRSDLEFYTIETSILHRLLDDNFLLLSNSYLVKELERTGERLLRLEREENYAVRKIKYQLMEIKWIATDMILENKDRIKDAQTDIQNQVAHIMLEYRMLKKDIFTLVGHQKQHERQLAYNTHLA